MPEIFRAGKTGRHGTNAGFKPIPMRVRGDAKVTPAKSTSTAAKRQPTEAQVMSHITTTMKRQAKKTDLPRLAPAGGQRKQAEEVGPNYGGDTITPVSAATLKELLYKSPPTQAEDDYLDELLTRLLAEKKLAAKLLTVGSRSTKHYWVPPPA